MSLQTITSVSTKKPLYEGDFPSFTACLEQAVADKTNLTGADLKNRNLSNACLDDGLLEGADFCGTNLTGANLSEASLSGATLAEADLYNTCLAYADLNRCNFDRAEFGGTDITGANINNASFSTLSCFSLDFARTSSMNDCLFTGMNGQSLIFSAPPIVIRGLGKNLVVLTPEKWIIGMDVLPYPQQKFPSLFKLQNIRI